MVPRRNYIALKKQLKKNVSILLIAVIAVSSSNWLINLHFCGGTIVSFGLFVSANSCGMESDENSCENGESDKLNKKACCSDHSVIINSNDLLSNKRFGAEKLQKLYLSIPSVLRNILIPVEFKELLQLFPRPPWILLKTLSEYQVFRI